MGLVCVPRFAIKNQLTVGKYAIHGSLWDITINGVLFYFSLGPIFSLALGQYHFWKLRHSNWSHALLMLLAHLRTPRQVQFEEDRRSHEIEGTSPTNQSLFKWFLLELSVLFQVMYFSHSLAKKAPFLHPAASTGDCFTVWFSDPFAPNDSTNPQLHCHL